MNHDHLQLLFGIDPSAKSSAWNGSEQDSWVRFCEYLEQENTLTTLSWRDFSFSRLEAPLLPVLPLSPYQQRCPMAALASFLCNAHSQRLRQVVLKSEASKTQETEFCSPDTHLDIRKLQAQRRIEMQRDFSNSTDLCSSSTESNS